MRNSALLSLLACLVFACGSTSTTTSPNGAATQPPGTEEATPADTEEEAELFGAPLKQNAPEVALSDLLANPIAHVGKSITTSGTVRAVCQKRGCWMEVRPEEQLEGDTLRVNFFNYSFFMPKDSRGANVKMQGTLSLAKLTPEEVAHLESEGATFSKKNADGTVDQAVFTAKGVEMRGRVK